MHLSFTAHPNRNIFIDVFRGFAVLGILWVNIFIFGLPTAALGLPEFWGETGLLNASSRFLVETYFAGVMRGMLSVLFGASALIMLERMNSSRTVLLDIERFYKRLGLLIIFGLVHSYILLWPYDILYSYGIIGVFLITLRRSTTNQLFSLFTVLFLVSTIVGGANGKLVEGKIAIADNAQLEDQHKDIASAILDENVILYAPAVPASKGQNLEEELGYADLLESLRIRTELEIAVRQSGYLVNFQSLIGQSFEEQTTEFVKTHLLDIGAFAILGMALLKSGFLTGAWRTRHYAQVAFCGFCLGTVLGFIDSKFAYDVFNIDSDKLTGSDYIYDVRRLLLTLSYFSAIALLVKLKILTRFTYKLAQCGKLSLSLYLTQTVACNLIFLGFGFGYFAQFDHGEIALVALFLTLLQYFSAPLYLKFCDQGPFEKLMSALLRSPITKAKDHPQRRSTKMAD